MTIRKSYDKQLWPLWHNYCYLLKRFNGYKFTFDLTFCNCAWCQLTSAVTLAMIATIVNHLNERVQSSQRIRRWTLIYVRGVSATTLWLIAVRDFPLMDRNRECTQSNAVMKKCCPYDELIIAWIQEPLWTNSASIVFGRCTCPLASTISNKFIRSWNKTSCLLPNLLG